METESIPPPPLRLAKVSRVAVVKLVGCGLGEVALRRGLNASTLAPLCRSSFSSGVSECGSLLERKLVAAEFKVGLRGRKRSSDRKEPLDRTLSLDWNFFNAGRGRSGLLERWVRRGVCGGTGLTSEDPSRRYFGTVIQRF